MERYLSSRIPPILTTAGCKWLAFWTKPVAPYSMAGLRVGFAILLLVQMFWLTPELYDFYGEKGVVQGSLNSYLGGAGPLPSFYEVYQLMGLASTTVGYNHFLLGCLSLIVALAVVLALGWRVRLIAFCLWVLHTCLLDSNLLTNYGVDRFFHIVLFYLSIAPSNRTLSLFPQQFATGSRQQLLETIGCRLVQLHLCLVYFDAGFSKALGSTWWNGEAIWRALMLPEFNQFDLSWMAWAPFIPLIMGWATVLIELAYPILIWIPRTRLTVVHLTLALHAGIAIFQGLHLFALAMMVMTGTLFGLSNCYQRTIPAQSFNHRLRQLVLAKHKPV